MPVTNARKHAGFRHMIAVAALCVVVVGGLAMRAVGAAAAEQPIDGSWEGKLKLGAVELRIVLNFAKDKDGKLTAILDSPDEGAKDIAIDAVTRSGDAIKVDARRLRATYEGTLSADGRQIKGQWKQAGHELSLDLARLEGQPVYRRPQDPEKPYPYREETVSYENAAAGVKLAGTLTLPESDRPVPAVLLISGSGAQDRDESILGHKPFLVLADYLTRQGIAVLRVDDRGIGGSTGDPSNSTTEDFAADALAGVAFLKGRREISPRRIGLAGHSEGGMIAPLAAMQSPDVAFIVLMAATGVTGDEIIVRQGELIARAQKADEQKIADSRVLQRQLLDIVKREPDTAKAQAQIRAALANSDALSAADTPATREAIEAQISAQVEVMLTPWFRYFIAYDPAPALRNVRCPVLAINGEKDLQVDPRQNLPPIAEALKQAGNRDVTLTELPGLNHLFQHCQTGSPVEYGKIDETFAPAALELVGEWILAHTQ